MTEEALRNIEAAQMIECHYFPEFKREDDGGIVDSVIECHSILKLKEFKYLPKIIELYFDNYIFDSYIEAIMSIIRDNPKFEVFPTGNVYDVIDFFDEEILSYARNRKHFLDSIKHDQCNDYRVKPIASFLEAAEFQSFADWCITDSLSDYEAYTDNGEMFYFCMKSGFENEPKKLKDEFPWDDYGKSLVAVSVNRHGLLVNVTNRWNVESNIGYMVDDVALSRMIGRNFYDVFTPRDIS